MARALLILSFLAATSIAFAQHDHTAAAPAAKPTAQTALLPGMGNAHHPVSTSNPMAQKYFDEGLSLIYAFNHVEAEKAFAHAAQLDPNLAMAHWGIAVAVGPNYNLPVDEPREIQAYNEIQKALKMKASSSEHAYIEALATRYIGDPHGKDLKPLDLAYRDAMRELSAEYPDDLDAATLFAESGMNINPWKLHHPDGTPAEGTPEIIATLESVMRRDPNHMLAIQRAHDLTAWSDKYVQDMPMMQGFLAIEPLVLVRFHKWDEILKQPAPTGSDLRSLNMHFARALAYAAKKDMANADKEKEAFEAVRAKIPTDLPVSPARNLSAQVR